MTIGTPLRRRRALAIAAAGGLGLALVAWRVQAQGEPRVIQVTARRFTYSPNEIHLKLGEAVVLELQSLDVLMGFNCPDFKVRADVPPGKLTRVELKPDKVGTFTFFCDIFCGSGHEDMNGTFVVEV
jgi:cytochrome c oxidase subunit 2